MAAAQRSFDTAFSRLGDEITRRETTQAKNYDQGKINNTEAFLAQISQYRTPEELQAAQQSGVFDALSQRFGAQVDQAAVRQAQDLRPGVLQERVQRENQFNDTQLDRAQAPTRDAIMAAINRGDILTANTLMSGAPEMRNMAGLEAASAQAQRGFVTAARGDADAAHLAARRPLEITQLTNTIDAQAAEAAMRPKIEADRLAERESRRKREEAADAAAKLTAAVKTREAEGIRIVKGTSLESGDLRSGNAMSKVQEAMGKLKDVTPQNINEMYAAINDVAPGGMITVTRGGKTTQLPVPVDVVIKALQGAYDSWSPFSDHGDAVRTAIKKAMDAPALQDEIIGVEARRALLESAAPNGDTPVPGTTPPVPVTPGASVAPVVAPGAAPNPAALLRPDIVTTLIEPRRLQFLKSELELHRRSGNAAAFKKVEDQIAKEAQGAKK